MSKKIIEQNRQTILQQIFAYVISTTVTSRLKSLPANRESHIKKKIEINFSKNQNKSISRTFYIHLPYINLVKQFIEDHLRIDSAPVLFLVDRIQSLFLQYRKSANHNIEINDFQIIDRIAESLIPPDRMGDVEYFSMAKATVLYVFEMCDIGKRPQDIKIPKSITDLTLFDKE